MDTECLFIVILTVVVGAGMSSWLSDKRVKRVKDNAFQLHVQSMSVLANACIEIQCVAYGATIEDAKQIFENCMASSGLPIASVPCPVSPENRARVAALRAAYLAMKEEKHVDTKSS